MSRRERERRLAVSRRLVGVVVEDFDQIMEAEI
jgi:hypothetical protein